MADDIPGYVTQENHDAAIQALRDEYTAAANERQAAIDALNTQITTLTQQLLDVQNSDLALKAERDKYASDNAALRQNLANYLTTTEGGQKAIADFRRLLLNGQLTAIQAELAAMG